MGVQGRIAGARCITEGASASRGGGAIWQRPGPGRLVPVHFHLLRLLLLLPPIAELGLHHFLSHDSDHFRFVVAAVAAVVALRQGLCKEYPTDCRG